MRKILALVLALSPVITLAADLPAGSNTMKLDNGVERDPVREDLKQMAALDREIKSLDRQITQVEAQANTYKTVQGGDAAMAATYEAQASTYAIERDRLEAERLSLRVRLHSIETSKN